MGLEHSNKEQRRLLIRYLQYCERRSGRPLGETAYYGWVEKYAREFRKYAETIPHECIGCGHCREVLDTSVCPFPFCEDRMDFLRRTRDGFLE